LFDFDHLKISDQNGYFGDDSLKKKKHDSSDGKGHEVMIIHPDFM
jgi:hypothetical protein